MTARPGGVWPAHSHCGPARRERRGIFAQPPRFIRTAARFGAGLLVLLCAGPAVPTDRPQPSAPTLRIGLERPRLTLPNELVTVPRVRAGEFHRPPRVAEIPHDHEGRLIEFGRRLFVDTSQQASRYVGNGLQCANCHLGEGRKPYAAPLWAAYGRYPQYREKSRQVVPFEQRLQDCFRFSLNGLAPTRDSHEIRALTAYAYWLAREIPIGLALPGAGFPVLESGVPSVPRGEQIYQSHCARCHGTDGHGRRRPGGAYQFPPLWGSDSYNQGAGLHRVTTCAAFVKANMPLGQGFRLDDLQALDVCEYLHHQERPWDPRRPFWSNLLGN